MSCRQVTHAVLLLIASAQAAAAEVEVLGARVSLPFDYRVIERERSYQSRHGLTARDVLELEITSGPSRGQRLALLADYWTPERMNPVDLKKAVDDVLAEEAKKPGTHAAEFVRIDDHSLQFTRHSADHPAARWPERMGVQGLVSGSVYTLNAGAKDAAHLTPEIANAIRHIAFEYESLVRARGQFDDDARAVMRDTRLATPIGDVDLGRGVEARLIGSAVRTDADGRLLARHVYVSAVKTGFWSNGDVVGMSFDCSVDTEDAWRDATSFYDEDTSKPVADRTVQIGGMVPARLLGNAGVRVKGKGPAMPGGSRRILERTVMRRDGLLYVFTVSRSANGAIGDAVLKQLREAGPQCRM